jgi:sterol-4alpha-carboxylate 3-dehydrogenase (decarboxylating)
MGNRFNTKKAYKILITGGSGFLGKAIVEEFMEPSSIILSAEIRMLDNDQFVGNNHSKVRYIQGDVRDYESVRKASEDVDIVIHAAAIVDWGTHSEKEVYDVNYVGTENVIKACQVNGVNVLIYTSSLDAVFTGKPLIDIDENQPYPPRHPNMYCETKALSEKAVVKANNETLKTCVLRPSDVYGGGDPYHIDSLINMAKTGFYVRLGNGKAKCQHVYVGNMAHAHILAIRNLLDNNNTVAGNIYFITDGPGHNFFSFFDEVVERSGYRIWPKNLWLPRWIAYTIGSISEFIAILLRPVKSYNPKFSRFAVVYTCTDFTFSSDKAKKDFGYTPKYSFEEAMERTVDYYRKKKN